MAAIVHTGPELRTFSSLNAQPDIQTLTGLLWHITSLEIATSRHSE